MSESEKLQIEKQQSSDELRKTSYLWVLYAGGSGLTFALGNVVFGISISQKGVYGGGFPGPATLIFVCLWKFFEQLKVKRETGYWIDKKHSNYYYKPTEGVGNHDVAPINDDDERVDQFQNANQDEERAKYRFNWTNLIMAFFA